MPLYFVNDQVEYQVTDKVPEAKTIRKFRETLIQEDVIETLFYCFNQALDDQSIFAKTGQIVNASFVEVPKQRNNRDENQQIKKGQTSDAWKAKLNKLCQTDRDAARLVKRNKMNTATRPTSKLFTAPNLSVPMPSVTWRLTIYRKGNRNPDQTKVMPVKSSMLTVLNWPRRKHRMVWHAQSKVHEKALEPKS